MHALENCTIQVNLFSCQLLMLMLFMYCITTQFTQQNKKWTIVKIIFLHKICRNSDMFRSVMVVFKELLSRWINKYV